MTSIKNLIFFYSILLFASTVHCGITSDVLDEILSLMSLKKVLNSSIITSSWAGLPCVQNITTWYGISCNNSRVVSIVLDGLDLNCHINDLYLLAKLTQLANISFKNNSISGNMLEFTSNLKLTTIDLSMNKFSGYISDSLLDLNVLRSLQLNDNLFEGTLPPLNQTSLKVFNVSNNNLYGEIPSTATLQSFNESSFINNPNLCGFPSTNPCKNHDKYNFFSKINLMTMFIVLDVIGFIFLLWFLYNRRRLRISKMIDKQTTKISDDIALQDKIGDEKVIEERSKMLTLLKDDGEFKLSELLKASAEILGEGCFGVAYKAIMDDRSGFVVKRVRDVSPLTIEEFANHLKATASLDHPNLLPILGYYYSTEDKLLVYNLACKGNLHDRIHGHELYGIDLYCHKNLISLFLLMKAGRGNKSRIPFKWNSRLAVAKQIAQAMHFLHRNSENPNFIPHGNLKSSNVLLESDDVAFVSDYGLMPLVPPSLAPNKLAVYKSPEYGYSRRVSRKSDVWTFGCLVLELISRKSPTAASRMDATQLISWVNRAVREEWTYEVFDSEIGSHRGAVKGMFELLQIGLWCCEKSEEKRPEMEEVVRRMEEIVACDEEDEEDDDETKSSADES